MGVAVLHDFVLRVMFDDGFVRDVDFEPELHGPMGEPLRDPAYFRQVKVDPEENAIVWPNGADAGADFLRWPAPPRSRRRKRTRRV